MTADLVCPECGKGPFGDIRALGGHRVIHRRAVCDMCREEFSVKGLGSHRKHCGRDRSADASAEIWPAGLLGPVAGEVDWTMRLLAKLNRPTVVADVGRFLAGLATFPADGYVIIGDTDGPWLCREANVGRLVGGSRAACVVLPLKVAADAAARERHRQESAAQRARHGRSGGLV